MADEFRPTSDDMHAETQAYPAKQSSMRMQPDSDLSNYRPAGKLAGKRALITGADSGIGRAVAVAFAMEGACVAVLYNENDADAADTKALVEAKATAPGGRCELIRADVRSRQACAGAVERTVAAFGGLDVLVNNAAYQQSQPDFLAIDEQQLRRTFETNIFGYVFMAQAALPHLEEVGGCIVNTGSVVGMTGNGILIDYASSKGAIHAFTRSLATALGPRGVRVNAVVPGPVWTPNIPATMPPDEMEGYGHEVALRRPGQPEELAPAYVMLASADGSFMTGSLVQVTGGKFSSDS